jgi:hypothetical protein
MISWLTNASKKRVIDLIKGFMLEHPKYREDAANVQNKYAFDERPKRGVIVDGTSGDRVKMAADNYMGRMSSFAMLTHYNGKPNTTVEWIRENFNVLEQLDPLRRKFPSAPGTYLFKVESLPDDSKNIPGTLTITPVLDIIGEPIIHFLDTGLAEASLSKAPIYPGAIRLWLGKRALLNGVDYEVDSETGVVTFQKVGPVDETITADYKYISEVSYDVPFYRGRASHSMINGLTIAFGDRVQENDEWAIVVYDKRKDVGEAYGGKFEMSFDILAFSKDAEDREKLSDYLIMKVLESQGKLGTEGFELLEINPGGENEDVFNPETDEFYYESSISLSLRVDWSIIVPLPVEVFRIEMTSKAAETETGYLDGSFTLDKLNATQISGRLAVGREYSYERIS